MKRGRSLELKQHIVCVLRRMLFIGVSIQIILGILWCITNIGGLQEFGEVPLYVEKGRSFIYLFQLAIAGWAGYFMMGVFACEKEDKSSRLCRIWGALGVMTIPGVMQCHLALLPNSIVCSLYMIMLSLGVRLLRNDIAHPAGELAKIGGLWLIAGMLMPEYRLLGGVLVLTVVILTLVKTKGKSYLLLVFAAFTGMILGLSALMPSAGNSIALRAVSRMVWPHFVENHGAWPIEITNVMSPKAAEEISRTADAVFLEFAPMMEEALGADNVDAVYWRLAKTMADIHTREIVQRIFWDGTCHVFSPYLLTRQLEGVGYQSYSGRNYEIMKAQTPGLTELYVSYEGWWFVTGIVLAAITCILTIQKGKKRFGTEMGPLFVGAFAMVIYYTMQGSGIMDYKQTIFVSVLWMLWICIHALPDKSEM